MKTPFLDRLLIVLMSFGIIAVGIQLTASFAKEEKVSLSHVSLAMPSFRFLSSLLLDVAILVAVAMALFFIFGKRRSRRANAR